jgi:hypothetical protein
VERRLGTNLIELGYLDLDALSTALGRQHRMPAALARHFDKSDPELQGSSPPMSRSATRRFRSG